MTTHRLPAATDGPTHRFYEELHAGRLSFPQCEDCGRWVWYPLPICPDCHGRRLIWTQVATRGRVSTYSIVHRAALPEFADRVPYATVIVSMDEADVNLVTSLADPSEADALATGAPVELEIVAVGDAAVLPLARLSAPTAGPGADLSADADPAFEPDARVPGTAHAPHP